MMISGIQALKQLDQGLGSVKQDIDRIDRELTRVSDQLHNNRLQQSQAIKEIAKVRLDALHSGELIDSLNSADRRAMDLFDQRREALGRLESAISGLNDSLQQQDLKRDTAHGIVQRHAQAVVDCEHDIQSALEVDSEYQAQLAVARQQALIAENADDKAAQAEIDSQEKARDYQGNALFMYLWRRAYGTTEYKANPLARMLDAWVDRLCAYSRYRSDYWTLLEIPKRMLAHAEQARGAAQSEADQLVAMEMLIAEKRGLPALQDALNQAQADLDRMDESIDQNESELNDALAKRAEFAKAKDPHTEQGLQVLAEALASQSLARLNDSVLQTFSSEDNALIREVQELKEHYSDLAEELDDHRQLHEAKIRRLKELEGIRHRFKQRRFDDLRSGFGNSDLITVMLGQFLNGLVNSGELWRVIERHQRHRDVGAWPDFGSGGVIRPSRRRHRSPWHMPGSRRGGVSTNGGFRLPRSGGFSSRGGGFRTGGGF